MEAAKRPQLYAAAAFIVATAIGVLLGNSTIAAINPAHYRTAAVHVAAHDAPATPSIGSTPSYRDSLSPGEAMLIREALCPGCSGQTGVQAASYSSAVPYFGSREERAAIEARERRAIDGAYAERERRREASRAPAAMGGPFEELQSGVEAGSAEPPDEQDGETA